MIQDKRVVKLSGKDQERYHRNLPVNYGCGQLWQVADLQEWPTSKDLLYHKKKTLLPTDFPIKILFEFVVHPLRFACTANLTDFV